MEQAFEDFIKDVWPGFKPDLANGTHYYYEDLDKYENLKEAFKAGYEAGVRKVLEDYQ